MDLINSNQFTLLIEGVKNFANLKENWNSECALPITKSTITRTVRLLHVLRRREVLKHYVDDLHIEDRQVSYGFMNFEPTPEGGIKIFGGFSIGQFEVTIPPEEDTKMFYEEGYVDEDAKPLPEYRLVDEGYTKDYEKIADIINGIIP